MKDEAGREFGGYGVMRESAVGIASELLEAVRDLQKASAKFQEAANWEYLLPPAAREVCERSATASTRAGADVLKLAEELLRVGDGSLVAPEWLPKETPDKG